MDGFCNDSGFGNVLSLVPGFGGAGGAGGLTEIGKVLLVDPNNSAANDDARTGDAKYDLTDPYSTLTAALGDAASGDSVLLAPGQHVITGPAILPDGVSVWGIGPKENCSLDASAVNTTNGIFLGNGSSINNFTYTGSTGFNRYAVFAQPGKAECRDIDFIGSDPDIVAFNAGSGADLRCYNCRIISGQLSHGWYISAGTGELHAINCEAVGGDASVVFYGFSGRLEVVDCVIHEDFDSADGYGLYVGSPSQACDVYVRGLDIQSSPIYGVTLRNNGASLDAIGLSCTSASSLDFYSHPDVTTAQMSVTRSQFRRDFVDIPESVRSGDNFALEYFNPTTFDRGLLINAELSVGSLELGHESSFGRGDSSPKGMVVLSYDDSAGTYTDVSAAAASQSGSTFGIGNGTDDALYVGHSVPFSNIKVDIDTVIDLGAGSVVVEYWNGSTWATFPIVSTEANFPYSHYGPGFGNTTGPKQARFGDMPGWATTAVNGVTKYWIRSRVVSAITSGPVLEYYKLGRDRVEINKDGQIELFGNASSIRYRVPGVNLNSLSPASGSPANRAINYADGITLNRRDVRFADSSDTALGDAFLISQGTHTAKPVRLQWLWVPSVALAGDVEFYVDYAIFKAGDTLDGSSVPSTRLTKIVSVPLNSEDVVIETFIDLDISAGLEGYYVVFQVGRDATVGNTNDTLAGDAELAAFSALFYRWAL